MTQRIIYINKEGGVSVVVPAPNNGLSVQEIADKDVPAGISYEIVDTTIVPSLILKRFELPTQLKIQYRHELLLNLL